MPQNRLMLDETSRFEVEQKAEIFIIIIFSNLKKFKVKIYRSHSISLAKIL